MSLEETRTNCTKEIMSEQKKYLDKVVDKKFIQRLLDIGHKLDINKGGIFDSRSGVVNIWASPTEKPSCWNEEIIQGCLDFPRDYVGGLYWEFQDENKYKLYIDASPYALLNGPDRSENRVLSPQQWQNVINWLEEKSWDLIRLAGN